MKVLQFSGGIDSLATLFVKRPEWDDITILWGDTGRAYPDIQELMSRVEALVPHFQRVCSDKPAWEQHHGIAVDFVPERNTALGSFLNPEPVQRFTSFIACCAANLWAPIEKATHALEPTHIIRGQRKSDHLRSAIYDGYVDAQGVVYELPIENWSRSQVFAYCRETCPEFIQEGYAKGEKTGRDCWDCIAYLQDNVQRIRNLPPDRAGVVRERLEAYAAAIIPEHNALRGLLQ